MTTFLSHEVLCRHDVHRRRTKSTVKKSGGTELSDNRRLPGIGCKAWFRPHPALETTPETTRRRYPRLVPATLIDRVT